MAQQFVEPRRAGDRVVGRLADLGLLFPAGRGARVRLGIECDQLSHLSTLALRFSAAPSGGVRARGEVRPVPREPLGVQERLIADDEPALDHEVSVGRGLGLERNCVLARGSTPSDRGSAARANGNSVGHRALLLSPEVTSAARRAARSRPRRRRATASRSDRARSGPRGWPGCARDTPRGAAGRPRREPRAPRRRA